MGRRDRRRAEAGALVASVLAHLVIFVILAHEAAPALRVPPPPSDFQVELVSAPPLPPLAVTPDRRRSEPRPQRQPPHPPARLRQTASAPTRSAEPAPRAIASRRPPPPHSPPAPAASPSRTVANTPAAGNVTGAAGAGGASAPGQGRWAVQGEDDGEDGVRKFLRATVGCQHADYVKLSAGEQADCDRRVGEEARRYLDKSLMDPDKRAAFIAAAEAQERRRANMTGPVQDVYGACNGQSNLGGGCRKDPSRHPDPFTNPPPQ